MRKIFEEYGGVIITVIAVVCLIALVTFLMSSNGSVSKAFTSIVQSFVDASDELLDGAWDGSGSSGGSQSGSSVLTGDGQEFYLSAPSDLVFESSEDYSNFQSVKVNGAELSVEHYAVENTNPGTRVTLKRDYLETLSVDEYNIAVISGGKEVSGKFSVIAQAKLAPGLYDKKDKLLASWDDLVNIYGLDVSRDYAISDVQKTESSPYYVINTNSTLYSGRKLVIAEGVTEIGQNTFLKSGLEYIVLPSTLTTIDNDGFRTCTTLKSLTIPKNVSFIGKTAFSGCYSLHEITVEPGNAVYHSTDNCLIETETKTLLTGCYTSVIPSDGSVEHIADNAFLNCIGIEGEFVIPDCVVSIGCAAFYGCENITSINIPSGVTVIDDQTFYGCTGLTSITIPANVTNINPNAFKNCTNLKNFIFEDPTTWYYGTYNNKNTGIGGTEVDVTPGSLSYTDLINTYAGKCWYKL